MQSRAVLVGQWWRLKGGVNVIQGGGDGGAAVGVDDGHDVVGARSFAVNRVCFALAVPDA